MRNLRTSTTNSNLEVSVHWRESCLCECDGWEETCRDDRSLRVISSARIVPCVFRCVFRQREKESSQTWAFNALYPLAPPQYSPILLYWNVCGREAAQSVWRNILD